MQNLPRIDPRLNEYYIFSPLMEGPLGNRRVQLVKRNIQPDISVLLKY